MKKIIIFIFLSILLNQCSSTPKKFNVEKDNCRSIYGYFTKSQNCLELKFESIDPKNYGEYQDLHSLILKAIADRVYENKFDNNQAWLVYEDVIKDFNNAKDKNQYLITVLDKYS